MKKLTQKEVLRQFHIVHGDKYGYDKFLYKGNLIGGVILCRKGGHGEFIQTPKVHKRGGGCPKCGKCERLTTDTFIKRAKEVHGNLYDYSKVIYVNYSTKVCIMCNVKSHNNFMQTPSAHLRGQGCSRCGDISTGRGLVGDKKSFVEKAQDTHGDKYQYFSVNYINARNGVEIFCPKENHGFFKQTPDNHIRGNGCPICNIAPGWNRSKWVSHYKGKTVRFYVLYCYNDSESFIKIGITGLSIKRRFGSGRIPYKYEILKTVESKDAGYIYDLESRIKEFFSERQYHPKINFAGYTECLTHLKINKNVCQ